VGREFLGLLERIAGRAGGRVAACGIPQMCYLRAGDEATSAQLAAAAARRGLLFKRTAYNFVSLAHTETQLGEIAERLEAAADEVLC